MPVNYSDLGRGDVDDDVDIDPIDQGPGPAGPDEPDAIEDADVGALADETTTIHVLDESAPAVANPYLDGAAGGLAAEPPRFPRRAFLAFCGAAALACAGVVAWRLMPKGAPKADADDDGGLANTPGSVPQPSDDGVYTVGDDLEPGLYVIECASAAKAGWIVYENPDAGGSLTYPEVKQACRVTVSAQTKGTGLTLDHDSRFVEAAPVTDLDEIPTHAGLFLVGTDIAAGTYELSPVDADTWCTTEFGEDAPADDAHPTLWHKTCARAASAARAAGQDIELWRGYVLEEPKTAGDVSCVLEDGAPSNLALLTEKDPTVTLVGSLEAGETMDSCRSWLLRHGLVSARADETLTVELTEGQVFAPVMMSMKRKA